MKIPFWILLGMKPKKKKAKAQDSHDSIASAAAAMGISERILKQAKKLGCPGFRGSRVYPADVFPWLKENPIAPETTKESIELQKLRKLTHANDVADGLYWKAAQVEDWLVSTVEKIKALLKQRLEDELPPKLEGLRAPEIAARMKQVNIDICNLMRGCPGVKT